MIKELPVILKEDENRDANTTVQMCRKIDELVKWTWKWEEKFKAMRSVMKAAGQLEGEDDGSVDDAHHPLYERK